METNKTHWLQSPNKNYLGHWDLPESKDLVLTIKSAQWEEVTNPITKQSEACKVIRFEEDVKPFICNQINSQSIINSTGVKYMEDSIGKKISLYIGEHKDKSSKQMIDCIRIRNNPVFKEKRTLTKDHKDFMRVITALTDGRTTKEKVIELFDFDKEIESEINQAIETYEGNQINTP